MDIEKKKTMVFLIPVREKKVLVDKEDEKSNWLGKNWKYRADFAKSTLAGLFLGLIVAILQPGKYTSETVILPEYARSIGYAGNVMDSRIGSILTSISTSTYRGRTDAVRIDLYPALMKSNIVLSSLLEKNMVVPVNGLVDTTYAKKRVLDYVNEDLRASFPDFLKRNTVGIPSKLNEWFQKDRDLELITNITKLSGDRTYFIPSEGKLRALQQLRERIFVSYDEQTGAFLIYVTTSDPLASAIISQMILQETHDLITSYQQEKFRLDYEFLAEELERAREMMDQERMELAEFLDRNTNAYSAEQQSVLFQKEYDFNLANNIYRSYLFQTEESRLKSKEETPLFTYLSPTSVPVEADLSDFWTTLWIMLIFVYIVAGIRLRIQKFVPRMSQR